VGTQRRAAITPTRLLIWLATAFFVVMLFAPLVAKLLARLTAADVGGPP
jgi:hypothetical protein